VREGEREREKGKDRNREEEWTIGGTEIDEQEKLKRKRGRQMKN
jgi:hypothetical protein